MLVQNSPGLQLETKSNSLTGRSIFCRSEFYKAFTVTMQNTVIQSLDI